MRSRSIFKVLGTTALMALLLWECAAAGRVPGLNPAAFSDSLVPRSGGGAQTAVVGARF